MEKTFTLLVTIFLLSCSHTDDSIEVCTQNCTTIKGKITSDNSTPISSVEIEFSYNKRTELTSYNRIIGKGKTDKNGEFEINAYLEDSELGYTNGNFKVRILQDKLENKYFISTPVKEVEKGLYKYTGIDLEKNIPNIFSRDTVINFNPIIPRKTPIILKIEGFQPSTETDKISIKNSVRINNQEEGFSSSSGATIMSNYGQENFEIELVGGVNFMNTISLEKRKNGNFEYENYEINGAENEQNQIIIEY